jgi:hypothetical protein
LRQFFYRADHVAAGTAAFTEFSDQTFDVRAGDVFKLNVLEGTGVRVGVLLTSFAGADISEAQTESSLLTSISGFYGRTAGTDMTVGSYLLRIKQAGVARVVWLVGASEQAALARVETEVRGN